MAHDRRRVMSRRARPWLHAVLLVCAAAGLFLLLNAAAFVVPAEPLKERVRAAYARGDLLPEARQAGAPRRGVDVRRGNNPYNDCIILMMAVNRGASAVSLAAGPGVRWRDRESWLLDPCTTLAEVAADDPVTDRYYLSRYTRYWHGYIPPVVAALQLLDLSRLRILLHVFSYGSVLVLALGGWSIRGRALGRVTIGIAVVAALFWGLPYFGQSLSHAPGDTLLMLGLAVLVYRRDRLHSPVRFVPFCAAYGAVIVYLEMLTGQLPTAAGLLFVLAYLMRRETTGDGWAFACVGVAAFGLGAGLAVVLKQAAAHFLVGPGALQAFSDQLALRAGGAAGGPANVLVDRLWVPSVELLRRAESLTYGVEHAAIVLFGFTAVAWLAAAWLALRHADPRRRGDFAAFAVGASAMVAWVFILPEHTFVHAPVMCRVLLLPLALGWGALLWQFHFTSR